VCLSGCFAFVDFLQSLVQPVLVLSVSVVLIFRLTSDFEIKNLLVEWTAAKTTQTQITHDGHDKDKQTTTQ
jgi:hypothetical protein